MKKLSLRSKQAKPKPIQHKTSINQPVWVSQSRFIFQVASKCTILGGTIILLTGGISQDTYIKAVGGIMVADGIGTAVGGRKRNNQLDQENEESNKMFPEKPQDRFDTYDTMVDCPENGKSQDRKNSSPLDTDSDCLTDSLEKLDQAILSDVRNC